jgi:hypothetical protein
LSLLWILILESKGGSTPESQDEIKELSLLWILILVHKKVSPESETYVI